MDTRELSDSAKDTEPVKTELMTHSPPGRAAGGCCSHRGEENLNGSRIRKGGTSFFAKGKLLCELVSSTSPLCSEQGASPSGARGGGRR